MIPVYSLQDLKIYTSDVCSSTHPPGEGARDLTKRLGCSELVAAFLLSRNPDVFCINNNKVVINTQKEEKIREMLTDCDGTQASGISSSLRGLLDELFLGTAAEASCRLWKSAVPGKRVFVWGDYDVDGVSSTVIALSLAQESGAAEVVYYIPDRRSEGYGLHVPAVRSLVEDGFDTLIVVDCGSKDIEAVELAASAGLNVMIFDHHAAEGEIVSLPTLVNPQIDGDEASRTLCATSVLWCWAVRCGILSPSRSADLLQLAALATVSDCMSLTRLNKAITREGIAMMRERPRRGLRELIQAMCPGEPDSMIDEQKLAMKIIPCLNAAGRVDVADVAVLVLSGRGDRCELESSVAQLLELNRRRRDISTAICASINTECGEENSSQVLFNASWPVGILSAVASRMTCEHHKAFALAAPAGSRIRGTLRVPDGANAVELLKGLDELLEAWGGHKSAAGFSVSHVKWQRFARELDCRLKEIRVQQSRVDVIEFEPGRITPSAWSELLRLGPFGNGNPAPLFYVSAPVRVAVVPFGKRGTHAKILCGGASLLAFNAASQIGNMQGIRGLIYRPRQNYWQGRVSLQYIVEGIVTD